MRTKVNRGFTLIELLVVIAIVAILAAILFPVFATAKEKGRQARCLSNMMQLGKAVRMYADEFQGYFPVIRVYQMNYPQGNWCGAYGFQNCTPPDVTKGQIARYVRSRGLFLCPSDENVKADWYPSYPKFTISYSMNFTLETTTSGYRPMKIDSIPSWRQKMAMMMIHESRKTINDGDFNLDATDDIGSIHYDGTTILYIDLHAVYRSKKQLQADRNSKRWDLRVPNPS